MTAVLVIHKTPEDFREDLEHRFSSVVFHWIDAEMEQDRFSHTLKQTRPDVVFSIAQAGFRGEIHRSAAQFETVKWVQCGGSGYDHLLPLDLSVVILTNMAGVLAHYHAETVIGAIAAVNSQFPLYLEQQRNRIWRPHGFRPLRDQSIVVVGLGATGSCVAQSAKALGMHVIGCSRTERAPLPYVDELFSLNQLSKALSHADVVSVHVKSTPQTHHLIDCSAFKMMPSNTLFVNTSRGSVVKQIDLIEALNSGHLRGAYLDVFEQEPLPEESPLWSLPNVLLTPHCADAVFDWAKRYSDFFADNLLRWTRGADLLNVVNPAR